MYRLLFWISLLEIYQVNLYKHFDYSLLKLIRNFSSNKCSNIVGVGWTIRSKLQNLNVTTCGDLQAVPLSTLQKEFGPKNGQSLHNFCRGKDDRAIKVEKERKSVSAEINYGIRFSLVNLFNYTLYINALWLHEQQFHSSVPIR